MHKKLPNKFFKLLTLTTFCVSSIAFFPAGSLAAGNASYTWTFDSITAPDYTYNSDLVSVDDINGAHPNNRFTNGDFENSYTDWSVAAAPPAGWVEVPGNYDLYGTNNFLVMKYEAKCALSATPTIGLKTPTTGFGDYDYSQSACTTANSKVVVSIASGNPIGKITQTDSIARCQDISLGTTNSHLLTNDEWMTIARNIEAQNANWSLGSTGQGYIYAGHNDMDPFTALEAFTTDTDNYRCAYTDGTNPTLENPAGSCPTNTASATSGTTGIQRRTHTLSNNTTIWDIAGNMAEWISTNLTCAATNCTVNEMFFGATPASEYLQFSSGATGWLGDILSTYGAYTWDDLGPSNSIFNSDNGIGVLYSDSNAANPSGTIHSFQRGGNWIDSSSTGAFYLNLGLAPGYTSTFTPTGFRCASDPVVISQSINVGTGLSNSYSDRVSICNVADGKLFQSMNLGNTNTYNILTYVYDRTAGNVGGTIDTNVAQLYANGIVIATMYTDMTATLGAGWWKLSGSVVGADESREYGLQVKTGKTVDVDNFTLTQQGTKSIYTTTAYINDKVVSWESFDADEDNDGASIRYQICLDDGLSCETNSTWLYYDGDSWETALNTTTHTNIKVELTETAMNALSTTNGKLSIKAIFEPSGPNPPLIRSLTLGFTDSTLLPQTGDSLIDFEVLLLFTLILIGREWRKKFKL